MSYQLATLTGAGWAATAAGAHTPTAYFRATYYSAGIITLSPQRPALPLGRTQYYTIHCCNCGSHTQMVCV